ncbi:hypothetical protein [Algoriphagus antarcticus]|uniref:Uncharacterized protein n=1 Tax=Algoriphagus antarcticus TaxID=238540 RepID=A0A3E0EAA6_9BACT|nr:hypothetical protein [Algoriphagus antarcticus]REG94673.1 hypothetical protein C8N25_101509 [Algoriphagus antarcticus]
MGDFNIIAALTFCAVAFAAWIGYKKFILDKNKDEKADKIGIVVNLKILNYFDDFALGDKPLLGKKLAFSFVNTESKSIYIHKVKVDFFKNSIFSDESWESELKSTVRLIEVKIGEELPEQWPLSFANDQHYIDLFLSNSVKVYVSISTGQIIASKIFKPEIIP